MSEVDQLEQLRGGLADRYEVQRSIGEGGMATVYLARDLKHDRLVAIKVLRPELSASIGTDRFLREIRVAAQLQHPNILALYDSGEAGGQLFYVMPFVEGESLRDRLNREKQLPIEESVILVREVADALHFAHQRGVVHRDIKPENILLLGGHVLVADFGIARALSEAGGEKLTQTGMAIGTPHYMSPEQGSGGEVDGRSDVYSLGCVLYELLVGVPPFDGPSAMAILARHSLEVVPSMRVVRRTVPDDLEAVVDEALEKSPADRFQSASDFSEALSAVDLSAVPRRPTARVTSARLAARKRKQRRTVVWGAAGAGVLALVTIGVIIGIGMLRGGSARGAEISDGMDPGSIAVLYFDARGGDSLRYLADGITEALIKELSGVEGLKVISRNGVRPYRGVDVAPDSIGRSLQVGTLVTGTVAQSANLLRVDVSLANARSGAEIGSRRLERSRGEIFALQDDLAKEVADFLRRSLGQEVKLREARLGTGNQLAWEVVQQAEAAYKDMETLTAAGDVTAARRQLAKADSLFSRAADRDRRWVTPVARRAWLAYRDCRIAGQDKVYGDACTTKGLQFAEAAVALDSTDSDAREARGILKYWRWLLTLEPDPARAARLFADAEADFRASIAANPKQASAYGSLSHLLANKAELAESRLMALKAYESDPYLTNANATLWLLFTTALDAEDQFEATRRCQEGERRFPEDYRFVECRLMLYALPGVTPDVPAAWRLLERYVELSPRTTQEYWRKRGEMLVAMALARAGLADSARRVGVRARADVSIDASRGLIYFEALMLTMLGDKDGAFERLRAYVAASPQHAKNLEKDETWWTRDLRSDPRWKSLAAVTR